MKLGVMTAALPAMSLEEVARWAAESRFGMLEIACWPVGKKDRRYGGVSHIDVASLDAATAREINAFIVDNGLEISSLAYYPNPLHPDQAHRDEVIRHLKTVIDAAALLEVGIVGTFAGADQNKSDEQNLDEFARVWPPIVRYAGAGSRSPSRTAPCSGRIPGLAAPTSPIRRRFGGACSRSSPMRTSGSTTIPRI
jgi:sugar phosphate isomerase/epimerase